MSLRYEIALGVGIVLPLLAAVVVSCVESAEAKQVELRVMVDSHGMAPVVNDLGYTIEVAAFRMTISDLEFTTQGELHAARLMPEVISSAEAHPGHYAGGAIIGEMNGRFIIDAAFAQPQELGMATLLEGSYTGLNFTFVHGETSDGLSGEDPLLGNSIVIEGKATRDGVTYTFQAAILQDEGRQVAGAPFEYDVEATRDVALRFDVLTTDPTEGDTLFDGIDFASMADDEGEVRFEQGSEDAIRLLRITQIHDHYRMDAQAP